MLVRAVMKRLFLPWKTKEKRLASLARLMIIFIALSHRSVTPLDAVHAKYTRINGPTPL